MNQHEQNRRFEADAEALWDEWEIAADRNPSEAYADLLSVGMTLAAEDLGAAASKAAIKRRIMQRAGTRRSVRARVSRKAAGEMAVAAAFVLLIGVWFTPSSYANGLLDRIISTISLGHITIHQVEPPAEDASYPLPEALHDKVFTKDGKPVYEMNAQTGPLFTADGEEIAGFAETDIVTKAEAEAKKKEGILTLTDPDTLSQHTNFKVKLPDYLPEGYAFNRAEQYLDENGAASPKYISLYFTKGDAGQEIFMQQRYGDDETAYVGSTDGTMEKVKVGGVDAVITNGTSIDWEADGVLYSLSVNKTGESMGKSDLIQIAESLK